MSRFPPKIFLQRHLRNSFYQHGLFWPIIGFSGVQPNTPYQPLDIGPGRFFDGSKVLSSFKNKMGYHPKSGGEVHTLTEQVKTPPHKQTSPKELLDKVSWDMYRPHFCIPHVSLASIGPLTMFHGSLVTPIPFSHTQVSCGKSLDIHLACILWKFQYQIIHNGPTVLIRASIYIGMN